MRVRYLPFAITALITLPILAAAQAPPGRSAADYLPPDALAAIVIPDGDQRVDAVRAWFEASEIVDSELYQKLEANPEFMQGKFAVMGFMAAAGVDPWKAAGAIVGRDLAVAVSPGTPGKPQIMLAMVAREPALIDRMLKSIHTLAGLERDGKPDESRSKDVDGVRVYAVAPELFHCRVDDALLLSNSRDMMKSALERRGKADRSLASSESFQRARKLVGRDAVAWATADIKSLRRLIPSDPPPDGPRDNPLGGFLLGAWWQTIMQGESAVAWIEADGRNIRAHASLIGGEDLPKAFRGFAPAKIASQTWNAADLPRFLSEMRITRGWADLFAEREALLTTAGASQALQFTSTMSTLFGGMDFLNDVLPRAAAPTRLIAARQDYSKSPIQPSPKLPAFALVQPLQSGAAADFSQRLSSATQMALSLLSLDMAQKNLPTYLIDVDRYKGQRILFSTFSAAPSTGNMQMDAPKERPAGEPDAPATGGEVEANIRYNFLPAAAVVEDQYIVATSRELLHDIIDRVLAAKENAAASAKSAAELVDSFTIDSKSLIAILRDNRKELVINRMLEHDEPRARAESTIDTILGVLDYSSGLEFTSQMKGRELRASLSLSLRSAAKAARP